MYIPSLNLMATAHEVFTAGFDPRGTFTRASAGYRRNHAGLLVPALSGAARVEYPLDGGPAGWLLEEQRSNLLTYSQDMTTATGGYVATGSATLVAAPATVDPHGTFTASKLEDATSNDGAVYKGVTIADDSVTRCFSTFALAGTSSKFRIQFQAQGGTLSGATIEYDLSAGTATLKAGTAVAYGIIPCGNGWWRPWVAVANNSTGNTGLYAYLRPTDGVAASTGNVYVTGHQIEVGAFPTSYIVTTSSTATRASDLMTIPTASISDFSTTEGTLYLDFQPLVSTTGRSFNVPLLLTDAGSQNEIGLWHPYTAGVVALYRVVGGTPATALSQAAASPTARVRLAVAYKSGDYALCQNGGTVATSSAAGALPSGLTALNIGCRPGGSSFAPGWYNHVAYWPRRLSNTDLQAITL